MKEGLFNRTPRMSKAEDMAFTPAQGISATELQTAIEEAVKKITVSIKEENTSALTKGQVICCTGASGEKVKVGLCDCDDPNKLRIMGLVFADIGQNAAGISVYKGELTGIDSQPANTDINPNGETWAEGALLWVADTPGGMTHTRPTHGRSIKAAISRKGSCADDILQVISHENPINVMAAAGEDLIFGMGDSAGVNKVSYKDYGGNEVASIDSDGNQIVLSASVKGSTGGLKRLKSEVTADITAAATVTIQANIPTKAKLLGVQMRVDAALAAGETWIAAYSGGASQNIVTDAAVAQNTKVNKVFDENAATAIVSGETDIAITKTGGGVFTAQGTLRAIVYYEEFTTLSNV